MLTSAWLGLIVLGAVEQGAGVLGPLHALPSIIGRGCLHFEGLAWCLPSALCRARKESSRWAGEEEGIFYTEILLRSVALCGSKLACQNCPGERKRIFSPARHAPIARCTGAQRT